MNTPLPAPFRKPGGPIVVRTIYPADPVGVVPGGVDTFIRGLVKWAPQDLTFEVVGMTTDTAARPVGLWTRCDLGRRQFKFLPVVEVAEAGQRTRVPLSVRYTAALLRHWQLVKHGCDVFEFHRVEPALPFLADPRPKNAFFHQDMGVIRKEAKADILWRYLPGLYFALESRVVNRLDSAWCVREEGVQALRARNPEKADVLRFVPTWVDTEVFSPANPEGRAEARHAVAMAYKLDPSAVWIVSVGRLDGQKDPELMMQAVARLAASGMKVCWLVIGDGVLRVELARAVQAAGLVANVAFMGLLSAPQIARIMSACDVYALSSAYEGMPMALLEALGCGLPVATTDVGEVRRVVKSGVNGEVSVDRSVESFTKCLSVVIKRREQYRGQPAVSAIQQYLPHIVLQPVYDNYRELGCRGRASAAD